MPVLVREDMERLNGYQQDWNRFAREILGVRLDRKQREALRSIQNNRRTSIRSGNARGKDFVAAVGSLCFLYLNVPSKVIETAPTDRQVVDIIMSEIKRLHQNAKVVLGGHVWTHRITFSDPDWFLEGFKAQDKAVEDWSGYHSPNLMVVVSEASGIEQETFDAIEGILTGNSRLVLTFNPNRTRGEAYESTKSPLYHKFKFNSLNSVNVRAKKILIPGQVDYEWVDEKIRKPGWVTAIDEKEAQPKKFFDFKWEGKWYRPSDLCLVRILGEFPQASEDALIPLAWVEMANERWRKVKGKGEGPLRLGVDVAGMGVDLGVHAFRRGNVIEKFKTYTKQDHMVTVGKIKNELKEDEDIALIDAIGEGAGVYSRAMELGVNVESVKGSRSAEGLTDLTGERTFANMRAYLHWALRDALDPNLGGELALPPIDELTQDLTAVHWTVKSNGKIIIEPGPAIKKRLGRSPDWGVATMNTFFPSIGSGFRYLDPNNEEEGEVEDEEARDRDFEDDEEEDDAIIRERKFRRLEEDEDD